MLGRYGGLNMVLGIRRLLVHGPCKNQGVRSMRVKATILAALAIGWTLTTTTAPAQAQTYKQVYSFPGGLRGREPFDSLLEYRGRLFGTTAYGGSTTCHNDCGAVFSINLATDKEQVLYKFEEGSGGVGPRSGLINVGGLFYGTTFDGGIANAGTIFSISPSTRAEKTIYMFRGNRKNGGSQSSLLNVGGLLYGVAGQDGEVFSIDPITGVEKTLYVFPDSGTEGIYPAGSLIEVSGMLYGTTGAGGALNGGTVFSVDPNTGMETVLHSFGKQGDGSSPGGNLIKVGDKLYGTTQFGGTSNQGTVFSIEPMSSAEKVIYSFAYDPKENPNEGSSPYGGLVVSHGTLYGVTLLGGSSQACGTGGCGTVFALGMASMAETVLHIFQGGSDGALPEASLTDVHGTFYGTTRAGGLGNFGTVFAVTP